MIRKEAWSFYRTISGVRLCWELEEPKGPKGFLCTGGLDVIRKEAWPFYRTISGVRLYWELEEPKGPIGFPQSFLRKGVSLGYVERNYNLKDLKE